MRWCYVNYVDFIWEFVIDFIGIMINMIVFVVFNWVYYGVLVRVFLNEFLVMGVEGRVKFVYKIY